MTKIYVNSMLGIPSAHYKDPELVSLLELGFRETVPLRYDMHDATTWEIDIINVVCETQNYAGGILPLLLHPSGASIKHQAINVGSIGSYTIDQTTFRPYEHELLATHDDSLSGGGLWSIEAPFRQALRTRYGGLFDDADKWTILRMFETGMYTSPGDLAALRNDVLRQKLPQITEFFHTHWGNASDVDRIVFFGRGLLNPLLRDHLLSLFARTQRQTQNHLQVGVAVDATGREIVDAAVAYGLYLGACANLSLCRQALNLDEDAIVLNIGIDVGCKNIDVEAGIEDKPSVRFSFPAVTSLKLEHRVSTGQTHRYGIVEPIGIDFGDTALLSGYATHGMSTQLYYAPGIDATTPLTDQVSPHVKALVYCAIADALRRLEVGA